MNDKEFLLDKHNTMSKHTVMLIAFAELEEEAVITSALYLISHLLVVLYELFCCYPKVIACRDGRRRGGMGRN